MKKAIFLAVSIAVAAGAILGGCSSGAKPKIGLSFSDFETERWPREKDEMSRLLGAAGFELLVQEAGHDAKLQNAQIKAMAAQGAKVIIVVAEDGETAAAAVDEVAKKGVKVLAYDRLIATPNVAAYISFDNIDVGRNQAKGILAVKDKGDFALLGGSPTDNNAKLLRKGQMEVLRPSIEAGKIRIVAEPWVENWEYAAAKTAMEDILIATDKKVDAVIASNDGTALGALEALRAAGLAGKVPLSGQDATEAGCKALVRGELTVTILKDTRNLTPLACDFAVRLLRKETIPGLTRFDLAELTGDEAREGAVQCKFLEVFQVTRENVRQLVVDPGFQSYEGVYGEHSEDGK
ncbi:MAG: substrate-binding domain-containing protein [Spirochaetaceae bacterium]|nr:substrate-binding domain-containing protein [Spirochaetaceae bacterium]